jgi:hypothetical protein
MLTACLLCAILFLAADEEDDMACDPCSLGCPMDVELVCHCHCHGVDWMAAYTRTRGDRVAWAHLARKLKTSPRAMYDWTPERVIARCKKLGYGG